MSKQSTLLLGSKPAAMAFVPSGDCAAIAFVPLGDCAAMAFVLSGDCVAIAFVPLGDCAAGSTWRNNRRLKCGISPQKQDTLPNLFLACPLF
eukprot:1134182-Pelagomonas_calceolata.AAC.1